MTHLERPNLSSKNSRTERGRRRLGVIAEVILGLVAVALLAFVHDLVHVQSSDAQTSGGGIAKIFVDGTTLAGTGHSNDPLHFIGAVGNGVFGDGHDGVCTFDGVTNTFSFTIIPVHYAGFDPSDVLYNYTLYLQSRDIFCTTMTIADTVLLSPQGFRDYALTSIVMSGNARISDAGTRGFDGINAGAGGGGAGAGVLPTAASGGGAGNVGAGTAATNGVNGHPNGWPSTAISGAGNGGAGAAAGGAGGLFGTVIGATSGDVHAIQGATSSRTPTGFAIGNIFVSGGGGGGDNVSHKGGGGGGAGSWVAVSSPIITTGGTSKIDTDGGAGGDGHTTGNTGGGGGGSAGIVVVVYTGTAPRTSVAGGVHGLGKNGGTNGKDGNDGMLMKFPVGIIP